MINSFYTHFYHFLFCPKTSFKTIKLWIQKKLKIIKGVALIQRATTLWSVKENYLQTKPTGNPPWPCMASSRTFKVTKLKVCELGCSCAHLPSDTVEVATVSKYCVPSLNHLKRKDNNKICWVLFLGFFFFFYITPTGQEMAIFHLCALSRRHYFFFFFDHQCSGGFKNNFCCCKTYQPKSDSLITIKAIRNRLMTSYWQYSQFEILLDWTWKTILAILTNLTKGAIIFSLEIVCLFV